LPSFTSGTQPSIGVDGSGNVTAVWHYTTFGVPTILAARMDGATGVWSSLVTVHAQPRRRRCIGAQRGTGAVGWSAAAADPAAQRDQRVAV
jgi:hypothetical protein